MSEGDNLIAMKSIGIITHYYNSKNYGGVLQAYALCWFLKNQGYDAEQIQFDKEKGRSFKHWAGNRYREFLRLFAEIRYKKIYEQIRRREKAFKVFRDRQIPHSEKVFSQRTLKELAKEYKVFITGSDQVWHPNAVCDAYLLDFGVDNIKKISYAASIAKNNLTEYELKRYKKALLDYCAISVRERDAVEILQPIAPVCVKWVVDPVFLLRKTEWEKVIDKKPISDRYVFCYFLGSDIDARELAQEYAKNNNLKVKSIAFPNGEVNEWELDFGDESIADASPENFVELIQGAEMVFTDSFHAMAFSLLFEKQFLVFKRDWRSSMESRIVSLAELFGVSDHFCNTKNKMTYDSIKNLMVIDYSKKFDCFEKMRTESIAFLLDSINNCVREDKK